MPFPGWSRTVVERSILFAVCVVVALFFLAAWTTGRSNLRAINLFLLIPLLGVLLGLTRLWPALTAPRTRSTIVYLVMCLTLLASGVSRFWGVAAEISDAGIALIPAWGDLGFLVDGGLWLAAISILYEYEGVVPDFPGQVEANGFHLSGMIVPIAFVLSVAGGADPIEVIKTGGNPVQIVGLACLVLFGLNLVMLLRLVHGELGTSSGAASADDRRPQSVAPACGRTGL